MSLYLNHSELKGVFHPVNGSDKRLLFGSVFDGATGCQMKLQLHNPLVKVSLKLNQCLHSIRSYIFLLTDTRDYEILLNLLNTKIQCNSVYS